MAANPLRIVGDKINRRMAIKAAGLGMGWAASGWFRLLEQAVADEAKKNRHCVLLWMAGGPSQLDTFDMKPGHAHGGEFKEAATSVPGLRFSEHLPKLAQQADKLAILRGMTTKEGDHARGTYLVRTGQRPGGEIKYPDLGSVFSKALGRENALLPNYFSVNPFSAVNPDAYSPGFLGPKHAAATVNAVERSNDPGAYAQLSVENLSPPDSVDKIRAENRRVLWRQVEQQFLAQHPAAAPLAHQTVYHRAFRMMDAGAAEAFKLDEEPERIRSAYGRGVFGQGCLVARRLIERGVPLVEVTLGGLSGGGLQWDTHQNNFRTVQQLSAELDAGWATLMSELDERGLLDQTTILWIGEFGRTPKINAMAGRDHFPDAWSCVLAGGGIQGGHAYGATSAEGTEVVDGKVQIPDLLATLCQALGLSPELENTTSLGRPVRLTEGTPIAEILA